MTNNSAATDQKGKAMSLDPEQKQAAYNRMSGKDKHSRLRARIAKLEAIVKKLEEELPVEIDQAIWDWRSPHANVDGDFLSLYDLIQQPPAVTQELIDALVDEVAGRVLHRLRKAAEAAHKEQSR